jgi:hypothetical protein
MFAPRQEPASFFPKEKKIMKRFTFLFVLCACLLVNVNVFAKTVVVGFEGCTPLDDYSDRPGCNDYWTWGFPPNDDADNDDVFYDEYYNELTQIIYTSKGATFRVNYGYDDYSGWEIWSGIGLSTRTTKGAGEWWQNGNDALSTTGSGNNDSKTYAVVYGTSWQYLNDWDSELLPTITLPEDATLKSIAIANLQYTVDSMTNGDEFAPPLDPEEGDYFDLIIYGIGKDELGEDELVAQQTVRLSTLTGWTKITFDEDWENVTELRFAFDGSSMSYGAFNNPVYFAFDDLTFELPDTSTHHHHHKRHRHHNQ